MIDRPTVAIADPERGVTYYLWRRPDAADPGPIPTEPEVRESFTQLMAALAVAAFVVFVFVLGLALGAVLSTVSAAGAGSSPDLAVEGTAAIAAPAEDLGGVARERAGVARAMSTEAPAASEPSVPTTHDGSPLRDDPPAPRSVLGRRPDVLDARSTPAPWTRPPFARVDEQIIRAAAAEFSVDPEQLLALAMCESSLNVLAVGAAHEISLFQWLPRTWASNAPRLGYTIADIVDPVAQARLTALVLREDGGWRWTCAR